jgi:erythromycin esterase-like protein
METLNTLNTKNKTTLVGVIKNHASPLENLEDLDPLMDYIGDSKYVLLGEASHRLHEYYTWSKKITQRLIREKAFHLWALKATGRLLA